jgi:AcrR family transcriptional regulator
VRKRARPGPRKTRRAYHHGDLRRALIEEAARTIGAQGVEALTLREVGKRLGVSRTALYRHFADKSGLLAAVAREGFQRLRQALIDACEGAGRGRAGLDAMGVAYVRFALDHPSHYRVMFGSFRRLCASDAGLQADAAAAFRVLVDALASLNPASTPERIHQIAHYVWAAVHGIAMLGIDGQLGPEPAAPERLVRFAMEHMHEGVF